MVTPLGGADMAPERRYLDSWWKGVERAIKAIDAGCDVADLPKEAIEMLAPVILGQAGWELVCMHAFSSWESFKGVVDNRFGVLEEYQRDLFLQIERENGEDGPDFIERVEDTRVRLQLSHEGALMKAWGNLPTDVTSYLENRHEMMGLGPIQWEHLVEYSKRQLAKRTSKTANKKLLPTAARQGRQVAPAAPAAPRVTPPLPRAPARATYIPRTTLPRPPPGRPAQK